MSKYIKADYMADPTGTSALAYWKRHHLIPAGVEVYHERHFRPEQAHGAKLERYFRLVHYLSYVRTLQIPAGMTIRELSPEDDPALIQQINAAYRDLAIHIDETWLARWRAAPVYFPQGWLGLFQGEQMVASIICEYDPEIQEGVVDWLQVDLKHQGQGLAQVLLCHALHVLKTKADFVTVSGSLDNKSDPEWVYRKCGFIGQDIWYIVAR